jgi:hydrogenase maturation factor
MTSPCLPAGKLPARALQDLLAALPRTDPRVVVGPSPGEDAAVVDFGDRWLVVTTDPITFATERIGWYAVNVNANDVAVMGAAPRWFFAVLLMPERHASEALVRTIMDDISASCAEIGVTVCGGHTEITTDLARPIVVGQMMGEVEPGRVLRKRDVAVGDRVLLTQGVAIEGTAILARECRDRLAPRVAGDVVARAERLLFDPGISVVRAARAAIGAGGVHALHDPTEGGVATGLWELASAAGRGLRVSADRIPVLPETRAICEALALDPLALIASGALLMAVAPESTAGVHEALRAVGIPCTEVAEVLAAEAGLTMERGGTIGPLEPAARDEIAKMFETGSGLSAQI